MIVKICGITDVDDARHALDCGADWIGLNLVSGPRKIELAAAVAIAGQLPNPSRAVVLTASPFQGGGRGKGQDDRTLTALHNAGITRLQLYGAVTNEVLGVLRERGFETILVQPVSDERSLAALDEFLAKCGGARPDYVLFDAAGGDRQGGTGRRANWSALAAAYAAGRYAGWPPVILAGGLTPGNVVQAVRTVHPAGVDVSSGVELAPGRKDHTKVRAFVSAAREQSHSPRGS